jgi:hypothetical protein
MTSLHRRGRAGCTWIQRKILLSAYEVERQAPGAQIQGLEVKTTRCSCMEESADLTGIRKDHHAFEEGLNAD